MDGRIFWDRDGYVIEINASLNHARKSFTLAHEIAHTFFIDPDTHGSRLDAETERFKEDAEEEYLCDVAAAEMLMPAAALITKRGLCKPDEMRSPANAFFRRLIEQQVAVESLLSLASQFGTSLQATARRIVQLNLWRCHIGFWLISHKRTVQFEFGFCSDDGVRVLPGFCPREDSPLTAALAVNKPVEGHSNIGLVRPTGEPLGDVLVQEFHVPTMRRVITLALLEQRKSTRSFVDPGPGPRKNQGRLFPTPM